MYEYSNYYNQFKPNNHFDLSQFSLAAHPLNLMGGINSMSMVSPMMAIPPTLMRPTETETQQRKNYVTKEQHEEH
jgi:hypothetical protein